MKRSIDDVEEGRGRRQRRDHAGGWGVLSFIKHVPILNKLIGDDEDVGDETVGEIIEPRTTKQTGQSRSFIQHNERNIESKEDGLNHDSLESEAPKLLTPTKLRFDSELTADTFVFTRKNQHQSITKQQKILNSSVHDQPEQTDSYTPGSIAPRSPRNDGNELNQGTNSVGKTCQSPIKLFGDASKQSRISRGGLIKKFVLTREERRQKRPVPSRLLSNCPTDSREHSKVITEKILATLNAMDGDPLTKEAQKPTPSMTMSWGKYHLDVAEEIEKPSNIPVPGAQRPPLSSLQMNVQSFNGKNSTPSVDLTATHPVVQVVKPRAQQKKATNGVSHLFSFSSPSESFGSVASEADNLLSKPVKYTFSKPNKAAPVKNSTAATKPYQFVSPPVLAVEPVRNGKSVPSIAPKLPAPTSSSNPLDKFKVRAGTWTCSACLVNNLDAALTKCPSCETPKGPASEKSTSSVKTSAVSSSNPLAKFMQHEPGSWSCPSCQVRNSASKTKCPCCDTSKPGAPSTSSDSTKAVSAPSGISFGISSGKSSANTSSNTGITFGVSTNKPASESSSTGGFAFGVPANSTADKSSLSTQKSPEKPQTSSLFGAGAASKSGSTPSSGFAFGTIPGNNESNKGASTTSVDKEKPAEPAFNFGEAPKPTNETPAFQFSTPKDPKPATTSFSLSGSDAEKKSLFTFGAPTGNAKDKSAETSETTDKPTTGFSFGGVDKPATGGIAKPSTETFSFSTSGIQSSTDKNEPPKKPTFGFGDATNASTAEKSTPVPSNASAAPAAPMPASKKRGADTSNDSTTFKFGGAPLSSDSGASATAAPASTFVFGSTPSAPLSSSGTSTPPKVPAFGGASTSSFNFAGPSAGFGTSSTAATGSSTSAANAPPKDAPASSASTTFGGPTSTLSSTFGSTAPAASTGFGQPASSTNVFGASSSAPATTGFGQSGATTTLGATTPASTTAFGSTPATTSFGSTTATTSSTFNFGSSAPTASTFGASAPTTTSFGATAPTGTSSFGAAGSSTPAFGTTAPTTTPAFGAPASAGAFGTSLQSSGISNSFGAPSSTSFGASAPSSGSASAFGTPGIPSTSSSAFGGASTGFGSSSGFGAAPAAGGFGSNAAAPAFGASAPTTSFGGSFGGTPAPAFGATPTTGFGATTPGFGATPGAGFGAATAPQSGFGGSAPSAFSAPAISAASNSFNLGVVDPKNGQGRKILKAKSRQARRSSQNT